MILIGISGRRGSGKDTLADVFTRKYSFIKTPFAEELKSKVREDFGLTRDHTDGHKKEQKIERLGTTPRQIMIQYGQFFRSIDPTFWIKRVFDRFDRYNLKDLRVVISDVRFQNEANYIKANGGSIIRLERKPELNIYGPEVIDDISEKDMDNYNADFKLEAEHNITPNDLERVADKVMEVLSTDDKFVS